MIAKESEQKERHIQREREGGELKRMSTQRH